MYMNLVHTMQLAFLMHEDRVREVLGTKPIPPGGPIDIYATETERHQTSDQHRSTPRLMAPPAAPWWAWWMMGPRSSES